MTPRAFGLIDGLAPPLTGNHYGTLAVTLLGREEVARPVLIPADYGRAVAFVRSNDAAGFARYLRTIIERSLPDGGEFVVIAGAAAHMCSRELQLISPIPVIDMIELLRARLRSMSVHRVALLSTAVVMRTRLFGRLADFEVIDLDPDETDDVNRIHAEAVHGSLPRGNGRERLRQLRNDLGTRGAQAIVAAGVELSMLLDDAEASPPLVDAIQVHIDEITRRACGTVARA